MADRAKDIPVAKEGIPFILIGGLFTLGVWTMGGVWSTCVLGTFTLFYGMVFPKSCSNDPPWGESDCFTR